MPTNSLRRALALALLLAAAAPAAAENAPPAGPLTGATIIKPLVALPIVVPPAAPAAAQSDIAVERTNDFTYLLRRPEKDASCTIVLLHGSGGDESSLMSLAAKIAPDALLLGVRGRISQEGISRWYRRLTPTSFDQQDVRSEAEAFAGFLSTIAAEQKLNLDEAIFLGYSNGANLIAALTLLHPGLVHRAVLLRAMPVLEQAPEIQLGNADILTIAGRSDVTYGPFAPKLEELLSGRGARVQAHLIDSDHGIGDEDARLVREWLALAATQ
jgi:phospholipase/carboxylesterase